MMDGLAFNKPALRRLYNISNRGKGTEGKITRAELHTTITLPTQYAFRQAVAVGKGGYGSPVVELSLRVMLCLIDKLPVEIVGEELVFATLRVRSTIVAQLRELADFVENYQPVGGDS